MYNFNVLHRHRQIVLLSVICIQNSVDSSLFNSPGYDGATLGGGYDGATLGGYDGATWGRYDGATLGKV